MSVLDFDDVKAYLNITTSTDDDKVQATIDAAQQAIASRIGPLEPTVVTRRVRGGTIGLTMPLAPVISVTSVVPIGGGTPLALSTLDVDTSTGVVYLTNGWGFPNHAYTVTYTAGFNEVPADLMQALLELVRHLWRTQRGSGTARPGSAASSEVDNKVPGAAYLFPIRIEQLLAPYLPFGVA